MNNRKKQTPDNAFCEALQASIQASRHARKFVAQFVEALLKTRTSNLRRIAQAVEAVEAVEAEADSVYRQIQRFLKNENQLTIDYLKLLKLEGKLKIIIDRTEWKFGSCWVNILSLSVAVFALSPTPNRCLPESIAATARRDNPYPPRFSLVSG